MKNLLRLFPYLVGVSVAMACWKLAGVVEYDWWMVTTPMWATYLFLGFAFVVLWTTAKSVEVASERITKRNP